MKLQLRIEELEQEHARIVAQLERERAALASRLAALKEFKADIDKGKYGETEFARLTLLQGEKLL